MVLTMVVDVLCGNGGSSSGRARSLGHSLSVLELCKLLSDTFLGVVVIVSEFALDLRDEVVGVPLRQDLLGRYGLDCSVVVVLVDFSVNSLLSLLVSVWLDDLFGDSWVDILVNISCVPVSGRDLVHCGSSGVHGD